MCRRIFSDEKQKVLDLIQTRIDAKSKVCLTDERINQLWVDEVMSTDSAYDDHRVFGLFQDGELDTIFVLRLYSNHEGPFYSVSMMVSRRSISRKIMISNGYGNSSTILLNHSMEAMEKEGITTCYSIIPDHPKWKRAEENPNNPRKGTHNIEIFERIPAGQMPTRDESTTVMSRPFNLDMVVRKITLR